MEFKQDFEEIKIIVATNNIDDCITAYNWICSDLGYDDDKIYSYDDIMEQAYYQLEAELSIDSIENIIIDFINLQEQSIGILQGCFFTYNGYGNLEIIEESIIKSNLIDYLEDYHEDITDTDVFEILGIDYE